MLSHRVRGLNNVYYCLLAAVLTLCFWGYLLCMGEMLGRYAGYNYQQYIIYNVAGLVALALVAFRPEIRQGYTLSCDAWSNHRVAFINSSAVGVAILLVLVATKDLTISRAFLFTFLPLLYAVFFFCHRFVPGVLLRRFFRQHYIQRALLVGSLEKAEGLAQWRAQMASLGVEFVCFSDGSWHETQGMAGALKSLERVARRQRIAHVVLLGLPEDREFVQGLLAICNRLGSRLLVVNGLGDYFARPVTHSSLCGMDVIDVMQEPLEDPLNRLCKRIIDIAVALPVVAFILPPLIVAVWIVHRLQSPGPLFFRQTRSGRSNQPFRIFKFRTMHTAHRGQNRQATQGDVRVFSFGRLLRKTSLDEIPQFINVLLGDMSVVGPRPHMVIHNRRFCQAMESYHVRAFVKPGITGVAQVRGCRGEAKTDADIEARVRHDLDYIQHWSIWRDILIILETGRQVFFPPKTAY
jgi:exopolysaccharide biosynthesis polyprenyl glycosylphosphotransferase